MDKIVVVGSVALDSVRTLEGESREALGGSAVFFSLAARYFSPVSLVGVAGKDFPKKHRDLLESRGIDLSGFQLVPGKTFRWVGEFGKDLSAAKTLATHLNVFETFRPRLTDSHRDANTVFLANIDPELQAEVLSQMRKPGLVACDTMNYWISSKKAALKELLSKVNIFFVNEEEAKSLTGTLTALRAAETLREWGPSVVVVKKGEHGAVLHAGKRFFAFPAYPTRQVKDPTGAGDTFAGAFMGYLAATRRPREVENLKRALLYGTVMASFNVEDFSTRRLETLERPALDERFHEFLEALSVSRDGVPA